MNMVLLSVKPHLYTSVLIALIRLHSMYVLGYFCAYALLLYPFSCTASVTYKGREGASR